VRTVDKLEEKIGYRFKDRSILINALTHSSYANEHPDTSSCYERLEFVGDSVLGFLTAEFLYRHEPAMQEGHMTRVRADLVCEQNLFQVASRLELGAYLLLSLGEERSGGRNRVSVLADAVESVIAALYLDGGVKAAKRFVYDWILNDVNPETYQRPVDNKTALQEYVQLQGECKVHYELVEATGPDHDKTFTYRAVIREVPYGTGTGRTKKEAEQNAAGKTLEMLGITPHTLK